MAKLRIYFKVLTTFSKQFFFSLIFFMFSVLRSRIEHKKLLKTEHQCTFIYIMNFTIFFNIHFGAFLLLYDLVSIIFTIVFIGSEVCLKRCDSYGNFDF